MAEQKTLHDAFVDEIRDIYDGERQITRALPKMIKKASSDELRTALETHLEETHGQIERLEQVFGELGEKVRGKKCHGIAGLLEEGKAVMEEDFDEAAMDACLVGAGQRVEHYEMAAYGTLIAWGRAMGHDAVVDLLEQNLDQEKAADEKLSSIAEGGINQEAADLAHPDEDEEDDEKKTRPKPHRAAVAPAGQRPAPAGESRDRLTSRDQPSSFLTQSVARPRDAPSAQRGWRVAGSQPISHRSGDWDPRGPEYRPPLLDFTPPPAVAFPAAPVVDLPDVLDVPGVPAVRRQSPSTRSAPRSAAPRRSPTATARLRP